MRTRIGSAALGALALVVSSCTDTGPVSPRIPAASGFAQGAAPAPDVRISEFHYDNAGTDADEKVEISAPAGTDLTGWQVVPYNGNGGLTYSIKPLSGIVIGSCDVAGATNARGVTVVAIAGLQNGDPDGIALVNPAGSVVEFLSYGGVVNATNGPAANTASVDIGIKEGASTPVGSSLQRDGSGAWSAAPNTFGVCNDNQVPAPVATVTVAPASATVPQNRTVALTATALDADAQPVPGAKITWSSSAPAIATVDAAGVVTGVQQGEALITATAPSGAAGTATLTVGPPLVIPATRIAELHYDNVGTDAGEQIEVEGPAGSNLAGWNLVLYNGGNGAAYGTLPLTGVIPAQCGTGATRGTVAVAGPPTGIQNGSPDGVALVNPAGEVVEFLSYEGVITATDGPAAGRTSVDIGVDEEPAPAAGQSLMRVPDGSEWYGPATATFGACNPPKPSAPVGRRIEFSGRHPVNDPALPVGFQDQLFATLRDGNTAVTTTFTWSVETPATASVDANGVVTALAAGSATLRAMAADGTVGTLTLPTRTGAPGTAAYEGNAEFGEPADADASDDFLVRKREFVTSYNRTRGTPNWVSYNLDGDDIGSEDRCDCFTFDPALPADFPRYTTADYTGAGAIAGYGIDRGHLVRSFDRTTGSLDNAQTFYFTNIVPQAADNNQGPWGALEMYLGDLATKSGKDVYVVAGVAGSRGTVKNEGKITIPGSVWKVAVIMPAGQGLASVDNYDDLEVVAVVMPNVAGIRNVAWETYKTTVDEVEKVSGYDVLALLPDAIEQIVESGNRPPVATAGGPYAGIEGEAIAFAGNATDADGEALTFAWSFGDGSTAAGATTTHRYSQEGAYTARLVVTDVRGAPDTATAAVTVISTQAAIDVARGLVDQLAAGSRLTRGNVTALHAKLTSATKSVDRNDPAAALVELRSLVAELDSLVADRRVKSADAKPLRDYAGRIIASLSR